VLVSHNIVECFDAENPASLSAEVYGALRGMGFDGVAMTDDLAMGAIASAYGQAEAAVLAVQAGADMLITADYKAGATRCTRRLRTAGSTKRALTSPCGASCAGSKTWV
jgi:beta-N-acetylhexosaminidase